MNPPSAPPAGKIAWWLIGLLTTIVMGSGSAYVGSVFTQLRSHGEKIAVLESQLDAQRHQLDRMDHKIDRILDQQVRGKP